MEGGEPQDLLDTRAPSYIDNFWVSLPGMGSSTLVHVYVLKYRQSA